MPLHRLPADSRRGAARSVRRRPARFLDRLDQPAPPLERRRDRRLFAAATRRRTASRFSRHDPDATLIAGGTDLGVESNLRGTRWAHLVSVEAIDELQRLLDETDARVRIGAGVAAQPTSAGGGRGAAGVVHEWLTLFASPPIRNRATLGGNLATASPIGDAAPLLLALDAVGRYRRPRRTPDACRSRRSSPAIGRPLWQRGEMLTAIEIPKPLPRRRPLL